MKKLSVVLIICISFLSCRDEVSKNTFSVSGEIKNIPDQKIFLEQLYFSQKNPEILDTAEIKNEKFTLAATAPEEGMYRLRMEKADRGFIFINDKQKINFKADMNDMSLDGPSFNTAANELLKKLILGLESKGKALNTSIEKLQTMQQNDSSIALETARHDELAEQYKNFVTRFIDTASDPVVAMFALGYTKGVDPKTLDKVVPGLAKRFPHHKGVAEIVAQYNEYMTKLAEPKKSSRPSPGDTAPDFTMNDTDGKPFSLSQLKGKYVLVDFWASWCGPCRGENPNVVAAYNKFKDKNFTVLGVSLDEDKTKWLKAIEDDNLEWKQISDLKGWGSAAAPLYGFDGIPYNVLIDPDGKIIAGELRGESLHAKLEEVLK